MTGLLLDVDIPAAETMSPTQCGGKEGEQHKATGNTIDPEGTRGIDVRLKECKSVSDPLIPEHHFQCPGQRHMDVI